VHRKPDTLRGTVLTLYGHAKSRASRSLWMLEEVGIPYEHVPIRPHTESREPQYLRINPNGHIPSLDDDGFILWESLAINLYLAEKYAKPPLWPADVRAHARAYQWSFWAANEIEAQLINIAKGLSKKSSDPAAVASGLQQLAGALGVLQNQLDGGACLLGEDFTVADLNLASTLREPGEQGVADISVIDLAPFPKVTGWLDRCGDRAANRRVAALR
jgi:glutathione S-transferase